jgi:NifU-like protein involved in Fe-S cluster formation
MLMNQPVSALNPAAEFEYNVRVRELFSNLKHSGSLHVGAVREPPSGNNQEGGSRTAPTQIREVLSAIVGSREQGFSIQVFISVHDGHLQTVRYQAYGCPYFLAASESLAQWLEGRAISELSQWRWRDAEVELAVPASKRSRLLVLDEALAALNKSVEKLS